MVPTLGLVGNGLGGKDRTLKEIALEMTGGYRKSEVRRQIFCGSGLVVVTVQKVAERGRTVLELREARLVSFFFQTWIPHLDS